MVEIADIAVIGNGAVGSSIAFELARRGLQVARIGEQSRPLAASAAAGAMLGCFGEVTTTMLASPGGRAKLATDHRARLEWIRWDQDLAEASSVPDSLFSAQGTIVVLNTMGTAAVDSGNFRAIKSALHEYGEPFECVDPEELDWFAPDELARSLRAIYIPAEHAVDANRLLAKLDLAFTRSGGRIVDGKATRVELRNGRPAGVQLADGGLIRCGQVVIAAGAQSLELLDGLADLRRRIPPMVSGYGVSALLGTRDGSIPTTVIRSPNRAFACGIHCIPRGDGILYVGGTNVLTEQPRRYATVRDLQFLLECAVDQLCRLLPEASVMAVQVGNRPVSADGFPLIGPVGSDGVWLATGTYRDGLHQSPLLARHLTSMIEGKPGSIDELAPFTPVRRPLPSGSRTEIVDAAVGQMMASGYETRWRVTPEWPVRIKEHLHRHYAEVANSLHSEFTPPAEFIPKLTDSLRSTLRTYYQAWS